MAERIDQPADKWTSPRVIVEYADRLKLRSIRESKELTCYATDSIGTNNKAGFGRALEQIYFEITPGSSPHPDFQVAQVELKSTAMTTTRSGLVAKERLKLNTIDYVSEASATFTTSSFFKKCRRLLIVGYLHDANKAILDLQVVSVVLFVLDCIPSEDKRIILEDWEIIHRKIIEGKAHEISEGDTRLLGACTSGRDRKELAKQLFGPPAKRRAYSLKQSYLNILLTSGLSTEGADGRTVPYGCPSGYELPDSSDGWESSFLAFNGTISFEDEVVMSFNDYVGVPVESLYQQFAINPKAKHANYLLVLAILRRRFRLLELLSASGIQIKTIQLTPSGTPSQSMSFPAFSCSSIVHEDWESVDDDDIHFKNHISKRFMFVVFQSNLDEQKVKLRSLKYVTFWNMPFADRETVRLGWERTKEAVSNSDPDSFPKLSDRQIMHVRPHGDNRHDVDTLPNGTQILKSCFWLNALYIKSIVDK